MYRILENIANCKRGDPKEPNEERVLAVIRFKSHAEMYAEWCGENCCEDSTIFLQQAIGLVEENNIDKNKKWKTIRVYQPLALKEKGKM